MTEENKKNKYKLYKPGWIVAATFLGGPIAGCYMMSVNYKNLQKTTSAKKTLWFGIIASLISANLILFAPSEIKRIYSKISVPILYSVIMGIYADQYQGKSIKEHIVKGEKLYSGWKSAGIGLLFLLVHLIYFFLLSAIVPEKYINF